MKNLRVFYLFIAFMLLLSSFTSTSASAASGWTDLPEMKDVPLTKTFKVSFNQKVKLTDIDGIVILQGSEFIPVTIKVDAKDVLVTPVNKLTTNQSYDMRIFVGDKRYRMKFTTEKTSASTSLSYQGRKSVRSQYANNQLVENLHHYVANLGQGHPINIYVTDDYEERFGKGFAYDETASIIKSIEAQRKAKPYTTKLGTLNIFFYTNESNTPLPRGSQAAHGYWGSNNGEGVPTEMIMNGSNMPYDFRSSYAHEFVHYFDSQSFISQNRTAFEKYWGPDYSFWLLEGGAEYGGYFFYDYPENTKNNLRKDFVQPNRTSILNYAKAQGGRKANLLFDVPLDSFDDIYKASNNNYGITLSFFWYLVEQYGYDKVYDYVRHVGETYKNTNVISQEQKNQTARKFLGKTEKEVLKDWLVFFNTFDGKLQEYKETTTGTANYIFKQGDSLIPDEILNGFGHKANGSYVFAINLAEWTPELGDAQAYTFMRKSTNDFQLTAPGKTPVKITRNGTFYTGSLKNNEQLYAFAFEIYSEEKAKLVKGVKYKIEPLNNDKTYKWVFPNNLYFEW